MNTRRLALTVVLGASACTDQALTTEVHRMLPDGTWIEVAPLPAGRAWHSAATLADGRVLVLGGMLEREDGAVVATPSVLAYDPAQDAWAPVGELPSAAHHTQATLLPDGRVLVSSNVVFDPATGASALTEPGVEVISTSVATDGASLHAVEGDLVDWISHGRVARLELATLSWSELPELPDELHGVTITALPGGGVAVIGQHSGIDPGVRVYTLAPGAASWSSGPPPSSRRAFQTVALAGGRVLVEGSRTGREPWDHLTEIYDPTAATWSDVTPEGWDGWTGDPWAYPRDTFAYADDSLVRVGIGGWVDDTSRGEMATARMDLATRTVSWFRQGEVLRHAGETYSPLPDGGLLLVGGNLDYDGPEATK
jgi:hypothetical protein